MVAALGGAPRDRLGRGGAALADVTEADLAGLSDLRDRLAGVDLVAATDVSSPLLGLQGASALYAPSKGATAEQAQELEAALGRYHDAVTRAVPTPLDLVTGRPLRLDRAPGAGAAGGLGYGLLTLGARVSSGVDLVIDVVGLRERIADSALVVTGEGCLDWRSLHGSVVSGVATAALEVATPSVVIAGQVLVGRRDTMSIGLSGAYAVADTPDEVMTAMLDPVGTLAARAERVARTWSPRRPPQT
jgi:glycerate 2-kinase